MKRKRKIVFIIGSISQPRVIKRINSFINSGYEVEIYGFEVVKYNINAEIKGAKINIVGKQRKMGKIICQNKTIIFFT